MFGSYECDSRKGFLNEDQLFCVRHFGVVSWTFIVFHYECYLQIDRIELFCHWISTIFANFKVVTGSKMRWSVILTFTTNDRHRSQWTCMCAPIDSDITTSCKPNINVQTFKFIRSKFLHLTNHSMSVRHCFNFSKVEI